MPRMSLKPYEAPYKGHVQMGVDKQKSEYGTSTDAGRSKVTEGRKPPLKSRSGTSSSHGDRGYQTAKLKHK